VLDWVAQLIGLPSGWHGHIEDSASTSPLAAPIAARHATRRDVVVCSEHAHSSVDKAARMLGMEIRKTPVDEQFRMRPDALDLTGAAAVVATVGTPSTTRTTDADVERAWEVLRREAR
jgi:aromatic-L-amino-acid/L-tryptophan decarboxylase